MSLETGLVAYLVAQSTAAGARVHPEFLPQNVTYPAITYQRISTPGRMRLDAPESLRNVRVQVDCYAGSIGAARSLADEVEAALDGHTGDMGGQTIQLAFMLDRADRSTQDGDRRDWRVSMDFEVALHE